MTDLALRNNSEAAIEMVLDGLSSVQTIRAYRRSLNDYLQWMSENDLPFVKATVQRYRMQLIEDGAGAASVNQRLSAIRSLAREASDNGLLAPGAAQGIVNVKGVTLRGKKAGNWLSKAQVESLLSLPDDSLMGRRDYAVLALLLGSGLRRKECAALTMKHLQTKDGRPAIVDIVGKGNKTRSIPISQWAWDAVMQWVELGLIYQGCVIRGFWKGGLRVRPYGISDQGIRDIVVMYGAKLGVHIAPHDLRRTFARLAYLGGADLKQLQLTLGHSSIKTTEIYIGIEQDFGDAPADHLGIDI